MIKPFNIKDNTIKAMAGLVSMKEIEEEVIFVCQSEKSLKKLMEMNRIQYKPEHNENVIITKNCGEKENE